MLFAKFHLWKSNAFSSLNYNPVIEYIGMSSAHIFHLWDITFTREYILLKGTEKVLQCSNLSTYRTDYSSVRFYTRYILCAYGDDVSSKTVAKQRENWREKKKFFESYIQYNMPRRQYQIQESVTSCYQISLTRTEKREEWKSYVIRKYFVLVAAW